MDERWAVHASGLVKRFCDRRVVDGVDIAVPTGAVSTNTFSSHAASATSHRPNAFNCRFTTS